jgi:hypothetical protein
MSSASTVSTLLSFPGQNSIPPASFYNIQGLAGWLNLHPNYKTNFSFTGEFPNLKPAYYSTFYSTIGLPGYMPENVPLCSNVTTLSQYQALQYRTQISLFQKIYAYNSNAYINYVSTGAGPIYYTFLTNRERSDYNSSVQLINKLYSFKSMAQAPGLNWQVPFPIYM